MRGDLGSLLSDVCVNLALGALKQRSAVTHLNQDFSRSQLEGCRSSMSPAQLGWGLELNLLFPEFH